MSTDLQNLDTTSLAAQAAASASAEILQQGQSSSQIASDVAQSQQAQQPAVNGASENLRCEWNGCPDTAQGTRFSSADLLYEHVCERHVGRKSTNNLNLTCAWGQCRTTTVKRDHITSHIRVHVPLKPHKCEFCGKAFKRPQDLKKHVKTHADDSVIMRSPEPNGAGRVMGGGMPQGANYLGPYNGTSLTGQVPQNYYAPITGADYTGGQHGNQYYHPAPPQTGQHPGYGPVTYYGAAPQATYDYETRKRGYDALDAFFGQIKRREFNPMDYAAVSRRLFELQGLQLPQIVPSAMNIPAYQPVSAVGGAYEQAEPIQAYSLPPMGNAKSRGDLTSIDQILQDMQATIYDNDSNLAQSGTGQSVGYLAFDTQRASNSPTSTHMTGSAVGNMHHHHASNSDASTPGLTPPSSAQSFTSGQSPLPPHAAPNTSAMYPTLSSSASDMAFAAANAATLGAWNNSDQSQRFGGGMLQKAKPANSEDGMDVEGSDGSATPPASAINEKSKGKEKDSPKADVIDPALSSTEAKADKPEDGEESWLQNLRLIEWMREFIRKQLEQQDAAGNGQEKKTGENLVEAEDTVMTQPPIDDDSEQRKKDEEQLYPVLRHVEQDA